MSPRGSENSKPVKSARCVKLRKCPLCPKTFSKSFGLQTHISSHTQEKPFKCEHCDFRTACKNTKQTHFERNHKHTKLQKCPLCPKTFYDKVELRIHIPSHTREKPFQCEHCDFRTACRQRHQRHVERTHDKSAWETRLKYKCELCPSKFHTPASLRLHMLTHSTDRNYFPCKFEACGYKAKSPKTLQDHYSRVHSDERPFACPVEECVYRAKLSSDMSQHMRKHSTERPFHCSETNCAYKGKTQAVLNVHVKMKHGDVLHHCSYADCAFKTKALSILKSHFIRRHDINGGFKCTRPNCNFRAVTRQGLTNHAANHLRKQANICDFPNCGYQARQKNRLLRHMKIHSQVRPFPCSVKGCGFRGKTEDVLRKHKGTHNKEATLPCTFSGCAYLGRNKSTLKAHIRRHECRTLKACPQPGCTFFGKSSKSLRLHQQLHDDRGRPFACPFCPKFFASKSSLDVHSFSHTKERSIKCVYCEYGTYLTRSLMQHIKKCHPAENFNSDWLKPTVIMCEYCDFSGTSDAILEHKATDHTTLIVSLEKIRIKFL